MNTRKPRGGPPRVTSVRTVAYAELMKLPVDKFHQLIDDEPDIFEKLTESASAFSLDVARRVRDTPPPDSVDERTAVLPVGVQRIAPDDADGHPKLKRRPSKLQAVEQAALKAVTVRAFFRGAKKKELEAKKQHNKNRACTYLSGRARALRSSLTRSLSWRRAVYDGIHDFMDSVDANTADALMKVRNVEFRARSARAPPPR